MAQIPVGHWVLEVPRVLLGWASMQEGVEAMLGPGPQAPCWV